MYASYLNEINKKETSELLVSLRLFALENDVPIVTNDGIHFLNQIIKLRNVTRVLEIGTAIAYSAINMVTNNKGLTITTIERDQKMITLAKENVRNAGLEDRITIIEGDALEVDEQSLGEFDLLFIDAAKAQSSRFFNKYKTNLSAIGVIVTDNLTFHGLVVAEIKEKNLKQLVRKIDTFNHFVVEQDDFDTYIYSVGDGMSVSIKK